MEGQLLLKQDQSLLLMIHNISLVMNVINFS
jgi:hypothetical protein